MGTVEELEQVLDEAQKRERQASAARDTAQVALQKAQGELALAHAAAVEDPENTKAHAKLKTAELRAAGAEKTHGAAIKAHELATRESSDVRTGLEQARRDAARTAAVQRASLEAQLTAAWPLVRGLVDAGEKLVDCAAALDETLLASRMAAGEATALGAPTRQSDGIAIVGALIAELLARGGMLRDGGHGDELHGLRREFIPSINCPRPVTTHLNAIVALVTKALEASDSPHSIAPSQKAIAERFMASRDLAEAQALERATQPKGTPVDGNAPIVPPHGARIFGQ